MEKESGPTLATGFIQLKPTLKDLKGNLEEAFNGSDTSAAGESLGSKLMDGVKKVIMAAGIGKMIKDSIDEGAALQQSLGGVDTLFQNSAETVKGYAREAFKTAGISANEYMEMATGSAAALVASLGGDTEEAARLTNQAIVDMSDNANKMGTDLTSIQTAYAGFAKGNYTMLDNLKLGYGGTRTEMERLLQKAGEINGVKYDINNLSDIYEAIHTIQGELQITGATAAEAETTISGSAQSMKAAFKNLMGSLSLGEDIAPALNSLLETTLTFLTKNLLPAVGNIIKTTPEVIRFALEEGLPQLLEAGGEIINNILTGLTEAIPGLIAGAQEMLTNIGNSLAEGIPAFLEQLLPLVLSFTEVLRENFPTFVQAGIDLIMRLADGLIEGLPLLIEYIPQIISNICGLINDNGPTIVAAGFELLGKLINGIISAIPTLIANIGNIVQMVIDIWHAVNWLQLGKDVLTFIHDGIKNLFDKIPDIMQNIGETAKGLFEGIDWAGLGETVLEFITNGIEGLANSFWDMLVWLGEEAVKLFAGIDWLKLGADVIGFIVDGLFNIGADIASALADLAQDAWDAVTDIDWGSVGSNIIDGIVDGLNWFGGSIADTLMGFASDAWDSVCGFFGIHSPSTLFAGLGKNIDLGWARGLEKNSGAIESAMEGLEEIATPEIPDVIQNYSPAAANLGSKVVNNSSRSVGNITVNMNGAGDSNENRLIRKVRDAIQNEIDRGEVFA